LGFVTGVPPPAAGSGRPGSKIKSTTTRPGRCPTSLRCSTDGTTTTRNVDRLHCPTLRPQHRLSRRRQRRHGDLRILEDRRWCQASRPPVPGTRARVNRTVVRATAPRAARCVDPDRRPRSQPQLPRRSTPPALFAATPRSGERPCSASQEQPEPVLHVGGNVGATDPMSPDHAASRVVGNDS